MAGLHLIVVVAAVVSSVNAIPPPSLSPYRTFPSLAPYAFGGVLERFRLAARGKFTIQPRKPGMTIQPRKPGMTIQPRNPGMTIQPREPGFTMEPRGPVFNIKPKDTVVLKSRPLSYKPRAETELFCEKKTQKAKLNPGDVVTLYSSNYPEKYDKNSKCAWKIMGQTETTRISITCEAFTLQRMNKKGKCGDYLEIDGNRYCGTTGPTYSSNTNIVKMKFKANKKKQYSGFKCTAVAADEEVTTTEAPFTTTEEPPVSPTGSPTCSCGRVNRASRIVGGVETEVNEYPWQVALAWYASSTSAFCGGSIINEEWILTAAHCADVMSDSNVVVVGEHSWSTGEAVTQKVGIEKIVMHPNYDSSTYDNDMALLKLDTPLTFDASNKIAPICPPSQNDLYESVDAIVTGWGTTSSGGESPDSLHEVVVPTMPNSDCESAYGDYITNNMLCAGYPNGEKDSCQGDSGGPLITADGSLYRQIGVVSWGYGCAYAGYPGVYARVNNYLDWIASQITGTSWCESGTVATSGPINTTPEPIKTEEPTGSCSCGRVNPVTRIVGGVETKVNEYPWMVALAFYSSSSSAFCGGSIIHESFVLTAAHCVAIMDGSEVVVIGEHQWSSSGESTVRETVTISEIISHQNYNSNTMENDVALLRLSSPLTFGSDNKIAPICPPVAGNLYSDINAVVTGWGTTESGGSVSDTLLEVTVPTMINSDCQDNYAVYGDAVITDDMLCAGLPEGGKDSCQGDSGGPMITQDASIHRQIGVVSWGYGCAYAGLPGVYARVTSQLDWISSKMAGYNWCSADSGPAPVTPEPTEPPATNLPTVSSGQCSCFDDSKCKFPFVYDGTTYNTCTTDYYYTAWCATETDDSNNMLDWTKCNNCQGCGRVNPVTRIVGGVETEVNEYPWMVALAFYSSSSSAFCGGSIIDKEYVLTAAHCAAVMDGSEVVVIGEHEWSSSSESSVRETVNIDQIISHPNYNSNTMENDVALLKLSQPLTFGSDNKIAPICPPEAGNLYSDINAVVTGWGTTSSGGSVSDTLLEVTVPTMVNSNCQENYAVYGDAEITDDMLCAGLPEGGKDSCQGDSGGPMITQDSSFYRQIGVVSWGYGCAYAGLPGVYARTTSQLDWISSQMSGSGWCSGGTPVTPAPTVPPTGGDCKCGRVNRNTRIVNGQETEVLEYPWQAGIVSYGSDRTWCGGSLINSKWVLTAAHCTDGTSPSQIQVLLGEHTIYTTDGTEQRFDVSQVINNPNYITNPWNNGHDISLLELNSEVDFSSTQIRPICLPTTSDLFAGAQATITGFGRTGANEDQSLVLMEVDIPVVTNDVCKNTYGSSSIDDTMICAGEGAGNGACMGDSGGPLITSVGDHHVQIGVVSFGSSSCDSLGVYARVTALQSWVEGYAMTGNAKVCTP